MTNFASFPDHAPLWIFASPQPLDSETMLQLRSDWTRFAEGWKSHGTPVRSGADGLYDRFWVVVADPQGHPSGCSIDSAHRFLRQWCEAHHLDLLDRNWAYYRSESGAIEARTLADFRAWIKTVETKPRSVFHTGISALSSFRSEFERPLERSWAASWLG
ncbi:hypothetical protein GC167_09470 [bacterium]|nr:hypothetical protein [bacterium]